MSRCVALVPAGGVGSRFGAVCPKQYLDVNGLPLMAHTLSALAAVPAIDLVAVVIAPDDTWFDSFDWPMEKLRVLRVGGASRAETVRNGLAALGLAEGDWVLVHDAARCCIDTAQVARLIDTLAEDPVGGLLALPVPDTVKEADAAQRVRGTRPRDGLWLAQTPQMFRSGLLTRALGGGALAESMTDEASAIEALGLSPRLVEGSASNFKVTWPADLVLARAVLTGRNQIEGRE